MYKISVLGVLVIAALNLGGCGKSSQASVDPVPPFKPTASVQEIMTSIIDPNIDEVWNSVSSVSTAKGIEDKQPHTDEEWSAVKRHAIVVLEATNLLLIEGRAVATSGGSTAAKGSAELDPNAIKKLIDSNRKDFDTHARELHDAVQEAIAAIDARNVEQLVESGGRIDHVCEQCHKQFWYPNDKRPTSVTGALSHKS